MAQQIHEEAQWVQCLKHHSDNKLEDISRNVNNVNTSSQKSTLKQTGSLKKISALNIPGVKYFIDKSTLHGNCDLMSDLITWVALSSGPRIRQLHLQHRSKTFPMKMEDTFQVDTCKLKHKLGHFFSYKFRY